MDRGTEHLERIFAGLYPRLHAYALGLLLDRDGAEDVCQEVFLKAHQQGERFLSLQNPRAYLYAMVRNACLDRAREAVRRGEVPLPDGGTLSSAYCPERDLLRGEFERALLAGLAALGTEEREYVVLRDLQGMGYGKIATLSGAAVNRVRWVLREGRQKLKRIMEAKYGRD